MIFFYKSLLKGTQVGPYRVSKNDLYQATGIFYRLA